MILLLLLLFMFLLAVVAVVVSFQHHLLPSAHRAKREPAFIHIIMLPQLVVNQSKHIYANPFPLETRGKWCIINSYTHTHMYAIDNEKQRGAWDKRKTYVAIMSVCVAQFMMTRNCRSMFFHAWKVWKNYEGRRRGEVELICSDNVFIRFPIVTESVKLWKSACNCRLRACVDCVIVWAGTNFQFGELSFFCISYIQSIVWWKAR